MVRKELNTRLLSEWVESEGGLTIATSRISGALKCSISKAEKIAAGRYPSHLSGLEQTALAKLTRISAEQLFPGPKRQAS